MREAAKRVIGQRHFDVQLMGGAALHFGWIAEMKTGEGKTLVSTLPAYLNGLSGEGMHLITVNDYLARLHAEWMGRIHQFLGLERRAGHPGPRDEQPALKRADYACDITYGTNNEFGFDYLRDNMATSLADKVQRGHVYAIVDEVDSILIDEARTPLIISGRVADAAKLYYKFASIVRGLQARRPLRGRRGQAHRRPHRGRHRGGRSGARAREPLRRGPAELRPPAAGGPEGQGAVPAGQGLHHPGGEVKIVDEFTGRILEGRRWSEGLHQAVEAKEGVKIKEENQTLATITLQNYFRMYEKLAGMTGTAPTEAAELDVTYGLQVIPSRPTAHWSGRRSARPHLQVRDRPSSPPSSTTSSSATRRPAGARRHGQRQQERAAVARCSRSGASTTRSSTPSSTPVRRRSSPRPAGSR